MVETSVAPETFEQFKNSFSYGSRSDLLFKFLKSMPPEEAAGFFQALLWKIGESLDDGDFDRVVQHLYESQARAYEPPPGAKPRFAYDDVPFARLRKPLSQARVGVISSGGHFVEGHDPEPFGVKNMTQEEAMRRVNDFLRAAPDLAEIPVDTPPEMMRVRHGGYDIRGAQADRNVVLPIDRLRELEGEGVVGKFHHTAYSFVGATSQIRLVREIAPRWAAKFREEGIEALLLVPV